MSDWIEKLNKEGLNFVDYVFFPMLKGMGGQLEQVSTFIAFKTAFFEEKLKRFVKFIHEKDDEEIKNFIENSDAEHKYFIVQAINKTVEMDDDLQIFILAYLTKQYAKNGQLNYYEKSLFYNIGQLSKDDFLIYNNLIKTLEPISTPGREDYLFYHMSEYSNIDEIVVRKFIGTGILMQDQTRLGKGMTFLPTEYTMILSNIIDNYIELTS